MYSYIESIKSDKSDELINTYVLRPIAGAIVWLLYYTPVTPNQVTLVSVLSGLVAAFFYLKGTAGALVVAGLLVTLKDILDSADGQLARAKQLQSRTGRFLDSIGDFIVDVALFGSIGWTLYKLNDDWFMVPLAIFGLAGISLRVSYHVFYQTRFLHLQNKYENNRVSEEIQEKDLLNGGMDLMLQRIFQFIYGGQDKIILKIDRWSRRVPKKLLEEEYSSVSNSHHWYSDSTALRISGLLGFGTELFLLTICSVFNQLTLYLYLNLILMNGIMVLCIFYRRYILSAPCSVE